MVRVKIEWTVEARLDLVDILEFYLQRNGNSIYSRKLNTKINETIKLLRKNPFLGKQTEDPSIRALITSDYQIIYEVFEKLVLIVMIWDCRRDPSEKVIDLRKK
jgi:plasmid stabilization system protein ParE